MEVSLVLLFEALPDPLCGIAAVGCAVSGPRPPALFWCGNRLARPKHLPGAAWPAARDLPIPADGGRRHRNGGSGGQATGDDDGAGCRMAGVELRAGAASGTRDAG